MEDSKLNLILASASPRRKELLGHLKLPFEIITSDVVEESPKADPQGFCSDIAALKAQAVCETLLKTSGQKNFLVVAADTIVSLGPRIYGKPQDRDEARTYLRELSGKTHSVFTAVCVKHIGPGVSDGYSFVEESQVTFDPISQHLMETYLDTGDSLDKAGAYGIQGPSLTFISAVQGSYSNVVGFPLSRFVSESAVYFKRKFPHEASWFDCFAL